MHSNQWDILANDILNIYVEKCDLDLRENFYNVHLVGIDSTGQGVAPRW